MSDGWKKREPSANLVIIGDAEGNARKVGGLLAAVTPDPRYPDNRRYELVQQDGSSRIVAGSSSINSQIGIADIGKFVKFTFAGWERGKSNHYKKIDVEVYEAEPTPAMKAWPRWAELQKRPTQAAPQPAGLPDDMEPPLPDDDDLPF